MRRVIVLVALIVFGCYSQILTNDPELLSIFEAAGDDGNYTVEYLIESNGYPVETHTVTTSDGYILTIHRIPYGRTGNNIGKVAFLQHGLLSCASDWCVMGAEKALAFKLADKGYDVWMGNARGTTWSRAHKTLHPENSDFWQFSWHEIGTTDIPAMIDYALEQTKKSQVYYVGHSQGTTAYYVMTSSLPAYNTKIKVAISLAPIAFMDHMTSPLLRLLALLLINDLELLTSMIGAFEFLPSTDFTKHILGEQVCKEDAVSELLCTNIIFAISGFSRDQMNKTLLPIAMKYDPAGASIKQIIHYAQEILSGHFRQYDNGLLLNILNYGSSTPPKYDLA